MAGKIATYYLTKKDVLKIHYAVVDYFANSGDPVEPPGVLSHPLLESALTRPRVSLNREEKYPFVYDKAAALFHSLATNHAFRNGNKRTALVALVVFLDKNGCRLVATDDDLFRFVLRAATNVVEDDGERAGADFVVENIRVWVAAHSERLHFSLPDVSVKDLLPRLREAGCAVREANKGSKFLVTSPSGQSIRFGTNHRKLKGIIVKRYLQKLRVAQAKTGLHFDEFCEGVDPEKQAVVKFRNVLRELAHA